MVISSSTTSCALTNSSQNNIVTLADSTASEADEPPICGLTRQSSFNHTNNNNASPQQQEHTNEPVTDIDSEVGAAATALHPGLRGRLLQTVPSPERSASVPNLRTDVSGSEFEVISPVARTGTTLSTAIHSGAPFVSKPVAVVATPRPFTEVLLTPKKPVGKPPGWKRSVINTIKYSWLNVLLVFVPVAWAMDFSHQSATVTFFMAFLAIIPLSALLGYATEELALRVGDALGGLLNATFGNVVELIIAILALTKGELRVVQSSMLGSILSNCLLVLGMCFFAGGLRFHEQGYELRAANLNINLLGIAVTAIVIPVFFRYVVISNNLLDDAETVKRVKSISHGVAILLLIVYIGYLTFQFWTHAYLFKPVPLEPGEKRPPTLAHIDGPQPPSQGGVFRIPSLPSWGSSSSGSSIMSRDSDVDVEAQDEDEEKDHNVPTLNAYYCMVLLIAVTVVVAITAEALVGSIDGFTATGNISKEFVALILLPLVGNAAEHVTAVVVATKNKLNLSITVAVGSSIQIALFVIPFLVLIGWAIGQPLTLAFDPFEVLVLFLSTLAVSLALTDGRSNWLEGTTLMGMYILIALIAWYYPGLPSVIEV